MGDYTVSVITPVYNLAELIGDAIESVRAQSYQDWEHILVDDCSTDDSWQVLEQYAAIDPRIRVIRLPSNNGAAEARNEAIRNAAGRYIAFLDGDDMWEPNKLDVQIGCMRKRSLQFTYSNYVEVDARGRNVIAVVESPTDVSAEDMVRSNPMCCSTVIYDTKDVGKVLMPLIRKRQDWGLWVKLYRLGLRPNNVGGSLTRYRVRSGSVSSNKFSAVYYVWRFYREILYLGFPESVWRTAKYVLISARKYRKKKGLARRAATMA